MRTEDVNALDVTTSVPAVSPRTPALARQLVSAPRRAAACYAAAGFIYAVVQTTVQLVVTHMELLPLRFLTLVWVSAWPSVLAVGIVAGSVRRVKVVAAIAYCAVFTLLGLVSLQMSPDLTASQLGLLFVIYNGPPTVLFMICLNRRIRAVGPLVLSFLMLALLGADLLLAVVGSQDSYMRWAVSVAAAVGRGGVDAFISLIVVGFAVFAVVGWGALIWIRRQYEAKQISDESVTLDAMWLLFAVWNAIGLAFESPLAVLGGVAAFLAYKATARILLARLRGRADQAGPELLLLRSFSIGHDAERLFDALEKHWRRVGSLQMIAGYDLATRTIEPHEFLDFLTGKLARRFINDEAALQTRLAENDTKPDRDGRFRVNDFFCYDDTWRMTFSRLARTSDVVLMDLRGFSEVNTGCVFEIRQLFSTLNLGSVVFVVDRGTKEPFLLQTFNEAAALAKDRSTGSDPAAAQPRLFRFDSVDTNTLNSLLVALAGACNAGRSSASVNSTIATGH